MKLNKSERELSNRIAVLLGLISVLIFWVGLFTGYHLYLWAVGVPWHLIPVTLGVFFVYLIYYRLNFRAQMRKTKEFYSEKNRKSRESPRRNDF